MSSSPNGPTAVRRKRADMAVAAEQPADIARQRPDIGSLAAFGLEHRMVGVRLLDQGQVVDLDLAGLQLDDLAVAGDVIGALALDLDGRIVRRGLLDQRR